MEESGNVEDRGGKTTVGKNPNLVSWNLGYRRDESGVVSFDVFITFSSKARAKTRRGDKQYSHTSAYALNLAQTMKIVKDTVPQEKNGFSGVNNLVNEMTLIPQRDYFLLEKFDLLTKQDLLISVEFKKDLHKQVEAQQNIINNTIAALNHAINSAKRYQQWPTSLVVNDDDNGQKILEDLSSTNTTLLKDLGRGVKRDYSLNVATKAAEKLLNYQNTAPYVTFPEVPTNEEKEIKFRKAEGSRVRRALGTLIAYSSSDLSIVQDFATEEDLLDEEDENTLEQENLSTVAETGAAATIMPVMSTGGPKRSSARLASQPSISYNEKDLQKKYEENAQQIKREEEEAKKEKNKTQIIANAIYNLLCKKSIAEHKKNPCV